MYNTCTTLWLEKTNEELEDLWEAWCDLYYMNYNNHLATSVIIGLLSFIEKELNRRNNEHDIIQLRCHGLFR